MTNEDRAWLAGLLEGDGTFVIQVKQGRSLPSARIHLQMNDQDVVERAALLMRKTARRVHPPSFQIRGRPCQYAVTVTDWKAQELMRSLYPLLGSRRRSRIDEILATCDPDGVRYAARQREEID